MVGVVGGGIVCCMMYTVWCVHREDGGAVGWCRNDDETVSDIDPALHDNHIHGVTALHGCAHICTCVARQCKLHVGVYLFGSSTFSNCLLSTPACHNPGFASPMASNMVQNMITEIDSVKKILNARSMASGGGDMSALQQSFGAALMKQINLLKTLSPDDGTALIATLSDSPYGHAVTQKVLSGIDAKLMNPKGPENASHDHTRGTLKTWWAYSTQEDWDFYRDPRKFWSAKIDRIVARAHSLGCLYPDEHTYGWMLATLLVSHFDELPQPKDLFNKLNDLKQACAAERKTYPHEQLTVFPTSPWELPKAVFDYAYPEGGPQPVLVHIPGISTVAEKIPLRKSSSLLKAKSADVQPQAWQDMKTAINGSDENVLHVAGGGCSHNLKPIKKELVPPAINVKQEPGAPVAGFQVPAPCAPADGLNMVQVPAPCDSHEKALLAQYKADLWKHRAAHQGVLLAKTAHASPCAPAAAHDPMSLAVSTSTDGSLLLKPRCAADHVVEPTAAKAEATKTETIKTELQDADTDLDDYAKAAIAAFDKRKIKKQSEQKTARQIKAEAAKAAAADAGKVKKILKTDKLKAGGVKDEAVKAVKVMGNVKKEEPAVVSKANILKACPTGASSPVLYKGGVIYTVDKSKMFRALRVKGDKYTESSCGWGATRTKKEAWAKVVHAIDKHYAK